MILQKYLAVFILIYGVLFGILECAKAYRDRSALTEEKIPPSLVAVTVTPGAVIAFSYLRSNSRCRPRNIFHRQSQCHGVKYYSAVYHGIYGYDSMEKPEKKI